MTRLRDDYDAPPRRRDRWVAMIRKQPSAVLLMAQIAGILLIPFFGPATYGRLSLALFGLIVLMLAMIAVRATPALTWLSIGLGIPGAALEITGVLDPDFTLAVVSGHVLLGTFYFYTAFALISYIFEDNWVTRDELFAVGAAFTVIAWGFAYWFAAIQVIWPGSFVSSLGEEVLPWQQLLFCSIANFTGVGLSDVIPVLPHAQSIVMVEQIGGVLYVAMVISRLVALTVMRARA